MGMQSSNHILKHIMKRALSFLILMTLIAGVAVYSFGQTRRRPRLRRYPRPVATTVVPSYYTIPANQILRVRMNSQISSESARVGDQFTTTVVDPVYSSGVEVIPAGSVITGRVTSVTRASRKSKAGTLGVHFVSLRLPTGIARAINGDLTDLTANNVNADN